MKFKSKKQKLMHHNKMEPDCLLEKQYLVKLIKMFKELFQGFLKDKIINEENEGYKSLKVIYEETQKKIIDPEYFLGILGYDFDAKCNETGEMTLAFSENVNADTNSAQQTHNPFNNNPNIREEQDG